MNNRPFLWRDKLDEMAFDEEKRALYTSHGFTVSDKKEYLLKFDPTLNFDPVWVNADTLNLLNT